MATKSTLNLNIGILGHVDSGKTSLAKVLSAVASTAAFDKNPQSRERGITLDLGFSSFSVPAPAVVGVDLLQFTLVDCPGHASLIRTIIGGAQIIDMMLLVVDASKGIQTQTAECLIIGEITCSRLLVVLNKVDLLPDATRASQVAKLRKRLAKTLEQTRFSGAPIVPVAANPGGADEASSCAIGVDKLIEELSEKAFIPERSADGPFVFSVDHCFSIRGQGTILTGTVLSGAVAVNETIEIPVLKLSRKIKSMQVFHKPVQHASQGDRLGICVTQFAPSQVERCLIASPGYLHLFYAAVIGVTKIRYHKLECRTGAKFHVSIGHETVMARATFFISEVDHFRFCNEFAYQKLLVDSSSCISSIGGEHQFALLEFEKPVMCPPHSRVVGSRLDCVGCSSMCRIAFHGRLEECLTQKDYATSVLPQIKVFKKKRREGVVDRIQDERTLIGKGLFKKETKIELFVAMAVQLSTGENGVIDGAFGTNGKFRVTCPDGLSLSTIEALKSKKKSKGAATLQQDSGTEESCAGLVRIILDFKRYIFDPSKKMIQFI